MTQESRSPDTWRRIEDARRQYVELFGSALVMNPYLKVALLCVAPTSGPDPTAVEVSARPHIDAAVGRGGRDEGARHS